MIKDFCVHEIIIVIDLLILLGIERDFKYLIIKITNYDN